MQNGDSNRSVNDPTPRRSFLVRCAAVVIGVVVTLFPFAAGWGVLFDPLRRRRGTDGEDTANAARLVRICPLDALSADGVPRQFALTTDFDDAWTRATAQRIGSVFLTRIEADGKSQVTAFTATCPHLGCAVEFIAAASQYECPCHASAFAKDGQRLFGPSRRGLDPLAVKLVDEGGAQEVWVAFERFRTGVAERIPIG